MSGGAQNLRVGDRVQIKLDSTYRYFLNGLYGRVTAVLQHGVIVDIENDPSVLQRVVGVGGVTGPAIPAPHQRTFQFHEVVKLDG